MQTNPLSPLKLAMHGVLWGTARTVVNQAVRIVVFLILARLLEPADFGLLALAMALTILAEFAIVEGGWTESLVRRSEVTNTHYDSLFWLVLTISLLLSCAIAAVTSFHATSVGDPRVEPLVYSLLVLYPLAAIRCVPQAILTRNFDFRTIAISSNSGAFFGGMTAIALALSGAGVWALVANQVVSSLMISAHLFFRAGWRPGFRMSKAGLDGVLYFVPQVLLAQASKFGDYYIIRVFLGARVGAEAVGFYAVSVDLRGFLRSLVILPAAQTVLPSVRVLRDDLPRLRNALSMGLTLLTFVVFPSSVGLSLLAEDMVPLLMGAKWQGAVPLVELIVLSAPAMALVRMNSSVQYAFGRASAVAGLSVLSTCILALALLSLPIATAWGAMAVLVFRYYAMLPLHFVQLRRATGLSLRRIAKSLLPNLLATGIMAGAIVVCQETFLNGSEHLTRITACIAVGVLVYAGAILVVAPATVREARNAVVAALSRPSSDVPEEGV